MRELTIKVWDVTANANYVDRNGHMKDHCLDTLKNFRHMLDSFAYTRNYKIQRVRFLADVIGLLNHNYIFVDGCRMEYTVGYAIHGSDEDRISTRKYFIELKLEDVTMYQELSDYIKENGVIFGFTDSYDVFETFCRVNKSASSNKKADEN